MRLLVITPEYAPHSAGGIFKYYDLMTSAWTAAGAQVSVLVCTPYSSFDDYERDGIRVRFVPLDQIDRHAARLTHLAAAPTYRRWIAAGVAASDWLRSRADAFDVVETTDFGLLFAPLVSVPNRPPLVVKLHGSLGQISEHEPPAPAMELDVALARLTEAAVLPSADALHALSPVNAAEWESRLGRGVAFVPPAFPLPPQQSVGGAGEFAGVVAGRIQSWKGPELLCRAFQALEDSTPATLRVAWIGRDTASGPDGQSMSAYLAATYPGIWGDRIVPVGARTAADLVTLQAGARFSAVPSSWDTFNFALAEAMGLGCVTLGSSGAGASYLIDEGTNGFRFAPDDPQGLGALMLEAHAMREPKRRDIGAAARETVARELDPFAAATASLSALGGLRSSRQPALPGPWIREFFESGAAPALSAGYLENVSIRSLASHLKTRVTRKIVG